MTRTRGFTLIELLVALALAGLVVAGAFQMHLAFNRQSQRQQQVAEMQQTLRVAMAVIERAIRTAGDGMGPTHMFQGYDSGCNPVNYYGFQFSNSNQYNDPKTSFWTPGTADIDPDWFRVVASDTVADTGAVLIGSQANFTTYAASTVQHWNVDDLFMVIDPSCAGCNGAVRQVDSFNANPANGQGTLKHNKGGSCYNPNPGASGKNGDQCLGNFGCAHPGSPIRHLSSGGTVYRVMTSADQGDATGRTTPKLTMRTAPLGTSFGDPNYPWIPIADNIEDMQIAIIVGTGPNAGSVCADGNSSIYDTPPPVGGAAGPTNCDFGNAAAVRVTLVARSAQPIQGVPSTASGGYEDEPSQKSTGLNAFYLRRSMTATIQLRNYQ